MKKNLMRFVAALVLLLALWNVFSFMVPFERTTLFWIGYALMTFALVAQLPILVVSFRHGGNLCSLLYGVPVVRIGGIYLAVQAVMSLLFMVLGKLFPFWIAIIVEVLLIVAAGLGLLTTTAMQDEIHRQDHALQANVSCMRTLQSKAQALAEQTGDMQVLPQLRKLADNLRYSDPVSSIATQEKETELTICLEDIEKALIDGDATSISDLCKKAESLLAERNGLCKLNK